MTTTLERRLADYAKHLDAVTTRIDAATTRTGSDDTETPIDASVATIVPLDGPRRGRRRAAITAAAAVAAGAILVVTLVSNDGQRVQTDLADEQRDVPSDAASAQGFFIRQGQPDEVVEAYLVDRLETTAQNLDIERLDAQEGQPTTIIGYRWSFSDGTAQSSGTVVLLAAHDDWWEVVEAFSDGASIDRIARDDGRMTIHYTGPDGADLRLILQDIDDNILREAGCNESTCTFSEDVPDIPIVVRLQLMQQGRPVTLEERRFDPKTSNEMPTTTLEPGAVDLSELAASAATRFMTEVVGDPSQLRSVNATQPASGSSASAMARVTMETSTGALAEVDVQCEAAIGHCTVLGASSPGFTLSEANNALVTAPTAGLLTITGFNYIDPEGGADPSNGENMLSDTRIEAGIPLEVDLVESSWLRMDLIADDGRVLRYLRQR